MRFRLIPRDEGFFPLFSEAATVTATAATRLEQLLGGLPADDAGVDEVDELERKGDVITRTILDRLDHAIITPFDREDIHALTGHLDDALDDIRAAADLLRLHNIDTPMPEIKELAALLGRAAATTQQLIGKLSRLRDLQADIDEVYRIESEGDAAYRNAVAHLFSGEFDAFQVLKWKDVVEALERALNGLESVAHAVAAIVLKHA
ncbi:MAG TPA: DUF47 family protein [Acidimicrobiales bacterium]